VLPNGTVAALTPTWPVPPIFNWLSRAGKVDAGEMLRVFNCGIGMALVVSDADAATRLLEEQGETVSRIGEIEAAGDFVPDNGHGPALVRFDPPSGWLA
jgi:phosphoribosylformylglycinamidine cyclo-ligase